MTLVRLEQYWNAPNPSQVTLFGIVTLVRLEQYENAPLSMFVTPLPIFAVVSSLLI